MHSFRERKAGSRVWKPQTQTRGGRLLFYIKPPVAYARNMHPQTSQVQNTSKVNFKRVFGQ